MLEGASGFKSRVRHFNNMNNTYRLTITTLITTTIFVVLKFVGLIVWPWWFILTSIVWIPILFFFSIFALVLLLLIVMAIIYLVMYLLVSLTK